MNWQGDPWFTMTVHITPLRKKDAKELLPKIDAIIATCDRVLAKIKEEKTCQN